MPEIKHHHKLLKAGVGYVYITSNDFNSWTFANVSINTTDSIIAKTLLPFYEDKVTEVMLLFKSPRWFLFLEKLGICYVQRSATKSQNSKQQGPHKRCGVG